MLGFRPYLGVCYGSLLTGMAERKNAAYFCVPRFRTIVSQLPPELIRKGRLMK